MSKDDLLVQTESKHETEPTTPVPIPNLDPSPRVELLRQGGIVRTIRVSCVCGCAVDIDCQYPE